MMKPAEVFIESLSIRNNLKKNNDWEENRIDDNLLPVLSFRISNKIKLIILGQDPTVKNYKSRQKIEYTLNLDKYGALKSYINLICVGLGIAIENIYATNVIKYFYTTPPGDSIRVMQDHLPPNLDLLAKELAKYKHIPIIALGQPVLQLLTDSSKEVKQYWDYNKKTGMTDGNFSYCEAVENKLKRDFFPFPHQPSLRKEFYKKSLANYISFVKSYI